MMEEKSKGGGIGKALVVLALVAVVGFVVFAKNADRKNPDPPRADTHAQADGREGAAVVATTQTLATARPADAVPAQAALPRLVDLGSVTCIPCKMMAPILEELKKEYAGRLEVEFIDVNQDKAAAAKYRIQVIPTQIFFDASGTELQRREGFISKEDILAKWKELGVDLTGDAPTPKPVSQMDPAQPDTRATDTVCYMCDGDIAPKTRTTLQTPKGDVRFCSPHCYFIAYSSLTDKTGAHERVHVADWGTGEKIAAQAAIYVQSTDEKQRPFLKAFAEMETAEQERKSVGGEILKWQALEERELTNRCAFCDRNVYPVDASKVQVDGIHVWGCCPMCALGVAARMQKDIVVEQADAFTGEKVRVKTLNGSVADLDPKTAVAWAGMKAGPDGKPVSTGCFKQAFFANQANLKKWLELHPAATGREISINQALAEKMKLTPQQISKACKIGECAPK